MEQLNSILLVLPFLLLGFWLWMFWEMANNDYLSRDTKYQWTLAFIFLNVFAAIVYYVNEYRHRD